MNPAWELSSSPPRQRICTSPTTSNLSATESRKDSQWKISKIRREFIWGRQIPATETIEKAKEDLVAKTARTMKWKGGERKSNKIRIKSIVSLTKLSQSLSTSWAEPWTPSTCKWAVLAAKTGPRRKIWPNLSRKREVLSEHQMATTKLTRSKSQKLSISSRWEDLGRHSCAIMTTNILRKHRMPMLMGEWSHSSI